MLVMHYFVQSCMNTIGGESLFRGRRKLARMKEVLDSVNVPEHPVIEDVLVKELQALGLDVELLEDRN